MDEQLWSAIKVIVGYLWVPLGVIMSYVVQQYQKAKKEHEEYMDELSSRLNETEKTLAVHTKLLELMDRNIQEVKSGVKELLITKRR